MINIYLLSKISGTDMEFRQRIVRMIFSKAGKFRSSFEHMARIRNWNSCYYLLLDFYNQVTPYCTVAFLKDLQKAIEILSESRDEKLKGIICHALLSKINAQLEEQDNKTKAEQEVSSDAA